MSYTTGGSRPFTNASFDVDAPHPDYLPTEANYRSVYDFSHQFDLDTADRLMMTRAEQTLRGFLEMAGNEEKILTADQHKWAEEGVMHAVYTGVTIDSAVGDDEAEFDFSSSLDDQDYCAYGEHDLIMVNALDDNKAVIGIVKEGSIDDTANTLVLIAWDAANWNDITDTSADITTFRVGSSYGKGTDDATRTETRTFDLFTNKPFIAKKTFIMNNTDITNITWLKGDDGVPYWHLGDIENTEELFLDDVEKQAIMTSQAVNTTLGSAYGTGSTGLFPTIESRGGNFTGYPLDLDDFDELIKYYDATEAEGQNLALLNTEADLAMDDLIAQLGGNSAFDSVNEDFGRYFGDYDNGKKFLDFCFTGFKRGSYKFTKQGWKLLRSHQAYGNVGMVPSEKVNGLFIPNGMKQIANDVEGNQKRSVPYLTMMYKGAPHYNRRYEVNWYGNGFSGGVRSIQADYSKVHFQTERLLRTVGAQKFVLMKGANA